MVSSSDCSTLSKLNVQWFQDKTALKRMSYLWDKYIHVSYARAASSYDFVFLRNITSLAQSLFLKIHFNWHVAEELFESGCTRLIHVFMKMNSSIMLLVWRAKSTHIYYVCLCTSAVLWRKVSTSACALCDRVILATGKTTTK